MLYQHLGEVSALLHAFIEHVLKLDFISLKLHSTIIDEQNGHLPFDVDLYLFAELHLLVQHVTDALADGPVPLLTLISLGEALLALLIGQLELGLLA